MCHAACSSCVRKPPASPPKESIQMDTRTAQQEQLRCWGAYNSPAAEEMQLHLSATSVGTRQLCPDSQGLSDCDF